MSRQLRSPTTIVFAAVVLLLAVLPAVGSSFFVNFVMTRTLILGLAAATIVFLSAYGGMVSLAQLMLFGTAGFMFGNAVLESGARGLNLGWAPWAAVAFALAVATAIAFLLGALSSRTTGIYYLMLTLVYAVIGYNVFAQVVPISGPSGITRITPPPPITLASHLYYAALLLSVLGYLVLRLVSRTPFGLALQGVRDDPVRMASLGFRVPLHRTLAFTLAGFIAGVAGLLNVWWNGQIDPASIGISPTLVLLIVAVIGGISHLEGAWLGAFVYMAANTYLRDLPLVDRIGITEDRFNTVIGALVLLIMVLSPEGLTGIIQRFRRGGRRGLSRLTGPQGSGDVEARGDDAGGSPVAVTDGSTSPPTDGRE